MKHDKLRLSHTSITNTKNQTSSESSNNKNERPDLKPTLSLDQQLKDYRSKHNRQRLISTTKYQSTKTDREFPTFGIHQKAVSFSKQKGDHRKEQYHDLRNNHSNKVRVNHSHRGYNQLIPKSSNYHFRNQRQPRTFLPVVNPNDFPPSPLPFRLSPYPPTHPRNQEWIRHLKYVNRLSRKRNGGRTFCRKTLYRKTLCRKTFCRADILPTDTLSNEHFVERTV